MAAQTTLSVVASKLWSIRESYADGYAADRLFDGGEFSGSFSGLGESRAAAAALAECGWTAASYIQAVDDRLGHGSKASYDYGYDLVPLPSNGEERQR